MSEFQEDFNKPELSTLPTIFRIFFYIFLAVGLSEFSYDSDSLSFKFISLLISQVFLVMAINEIFRCWRISLFNGEYIKSLKNQYITLHESSKTWTIRCFIGAAILSVSSIFVDNENMVSISNSIVLLLKFIAFIIIVRYRVKINSRSTRII